MKSNHFQFRSKSDGLTCRAFLRTVPADELRSAQTARLGKGPILTARSVLLTFKAQGATGVDGSIRLSCMHRQVPIFTTLDRVWFQAMIKVIVHVPHFGGGDASCGSCIRYAGSAANTIIGLGRLVYLQQPTAR